jgi:hypothetical protein
MTDLNDYEIERELRIKENKDKLQQLGIAPLTCYPKVQRLKRLILASQTPHSIITPRVLRPRRTTPVYKESPGYARRKLMKRLDDMDAEIPSSPEEEVLTLKQFFVKEVRWPVATTGNQDHLDYLIGKLEGTDQPELRLAMMTKEDMIEMDWEELLTCFKSRAVDEISLVRLKKWKVGSTKVKDKATKG